MGPTQAMILIRLGPERLRNVMPHVMTWLDDINWPGCTNLFVDLFLKLDKDLLLSCYIKLLPEADNCLDMDLIAGLIELADAAGLTGEDFPEPGNVYDIITKWKTNCGF